jgi:hypothetical protein
MIVGVPRESYPGERRVALVPAGLANLATALDALVPEQPVFVEADYYSFGNANVSFAGDVFNPTPPFIRDRGLSGEAIRFGSEPPYQKGLVIASDTVLTYTLTGGRSITRDPSRMPRKSSRSVSGRPKPARCWLRPSIATKRWGLDRSLPEPEPAFESLAGDGGAAGAGAERCPAGRA